MVCKTCSTIYCMWYILFLYLLHCHIIIVDNIIISCYCCKYTPLRDVNIEKDTSFINKQVLKIEILMFSYKCFDIAFVCVCACISISLYLFLSYICLCMCMCLCLCAYVHTHMYIFHILGEIYNIVNQKKNSIEQKK